MYSIAVAQHAFMHWPRGQKIKGQGHMVRKLSRRTVLLVIIVAVMQPCVVLPAAIAGVGLHVDTTAYVL